MRVEVPKLYPVVLLMAGIISFQCVIIGFSAGAKRKTIFDKEKIMAKFGEEHKKYFKGEPDTGGYPDHGDGLYGDTASYKDWFEFSLDQRSHKNFLEQVTIIVFLLLIIGMIFPITAIVFAGVHFVFRWVFVFGYKMGPKWRIIGAAPLTFSALGMIVMAIIACSLWIAKITNP